MLINVRCIKMNIRGVKMNIQCIKPNIPCALYVNIRCALSVINFSLVILLVKGTVSPDMCAKQVHRHIDQA
jgi:hypothetical protein